MAGWPDTFVTPFIGGFSGPDPRGQPTIYDRPFQDSYGPPQRCGLGGGREGWAFSQARGTERGGGWQDFLSRMGHPTPPGREGGGLGLGYPQPHPNTNPNPIPNPAQQPTWSQPPAFSQPREPPLTFIEFGILERFHRNQRPPTSPPVSEGDRQVAISRNFPSIQASV